MKLLIALCWVSLATTTPRIDQKPEKNQHPTFEERDGVVAVEAEHFHRQSLHNVRQWDIVTDAHAGNASANSYLECLPDTRITHADKLVTGENFSNVAGQMAILHYQVYFNTPGKYYVWVRAYSTGTEDNGIHMGIDGTWPESGQRMQWCEGKNEWSWASKQRTEEEHCGKPGLIFIEIEQEGLHEIQFSMREDGFEFDKFVLSTKYEKPNGTGPDERLRE
ncbi:MAG: hypothetical protein HC819_13880 [Cyclobacteriaceae bacterium]|nr:hypothetical protein [Cyclobacteriaceae bacterium]